MMFPTTPLPLVGGWATEVSDLAVSLNVTGVGVGVKLWTRSVCKNNTFLMLSVMMTFRG